MNLQKFQLSAKFWNSFFVHSGPEFQGSAIRSVQIIKSFFLFLVMVCFGQRLLIFLVLSGLSWSCPITFYVEGGPEQLFLNGWVLFPSPWETVETFSSISLWRPTTDHCTGTRIKISFTAWPRTITRWTRRDMRSNTIFSQKNDLDI